METCVSHAVAETAAVPDVGLTITGVLIIESMPARLRPDVEQLMVDCLHSESTWDIPGEDPLTAQWCTRWYKDWATPDLVALAAGHITGHGVGCRQVLTGTPAELTQLDARVQELARAYGFSARVSK